MKDAAPQRRKSCNENKSLTGESPWNTPALWSSPRMEKKLRMSIAVLIPVIPKRKADHSMNGTTV